MFDRRVFAEMRRAGMGVGVSKAKLAQAMLEILVQLPAGTADLKDTVVAHLGLLGQMSAIDSALSAANGAVSAAPRGTALRAVQKIPRDPAAPPV